MFGSNSTASYPKNKGKKGKTMKKGKKPSIKGKGGSAEMVDNPHRRKAFMSGLSGGLAPY